MMAGFTKFVYPLLIKEQHLDTFGHVNNATYLEILEEARWDFLTKANVGLDVIQKLGMGPVVLECQIKFLKELRLRQLITIETQIVSYEQKIGVMKQEIYNEERELCCESYFTFGLFDLKTRKLLSPPDNWLKAIGCL